jgi:hypothetical protein
VTEAINYLAAMFPDFCLCERSPILVAIFGGVSPHPKIPFLAAGLGHENGVVVGDAMGCYRP